MNKKQTITTILTVIGIIAATAAVIGTAYVHKNKAPVSKYGEKVTLGEYKKIPLTLEEDKLTDADIKETAEWFIGYYNQGLQQAEGEDKKSDKKEISIDTLTDAQVKEAFGMDDVDAFMDYVREYREEEDKKQSRTKAYEQICDYLLKNCTIENLPDDKIKTRLDKQIKDTKESCTKYYNMTFADYCKSTGMTEDEYKKSLSEHIEKTLKLELIFTAIGDKENIQYEEDAYESYIKDLIDKGSCESKEALYEKYGEEYMKTAYRVEYITDWLIEKADIKYEPKATPAPDTTEQHEKAEPEKMEPEKMEPKKEKTSK